jgi:hypothetical protein
MSDIATAKDFRQYCATFMSIYRVALKKNVGVYCQSYVSTRHGSLVFLKFTIGHSRFRFRQTTSPIGKVLERLPQRGIKGDLSNVIFEGKNVISGGNTLIIIKGENSPQAWSRIKAIRDAQEEVAAIKARELK